MTTEKKQPIAVRIPRTGINAKIWENQSGKDNETFVNFTIARTYKNKDGQFVDSNSFSPADIDVLRLLLDLVEAKLPAQQSSFAEGETGTVDAVGDDVYVA